MEIHMEMYKCATSKSFNKLHDAQKNHAIKLLLGTFW